MEKNAISSYVEKYFAKSTGPALMNFIRIPNLSPAFDPDWNKNKFLNKAAEHICTWVKAQNIKGAEINLLQDPGRTPFIFIEIEATRVNDDRTIGFYGHGDKQPPFTGWDENKGPTLPVIEHNKLFGRGGADDGYAVFSIITAIKCCQDNNLTYPRQCIIIEANEESSEEDGRYYFLKLKPIFGNVALFVPMDSGCEDYKRLWVTSTIRGCITAGIKVENLTKEASSYSFNGIVPDNFMLANEIIKGIQNEKGEIGIKEFNLDEKDIPAGRIEECKKIVDIIGDQYIKELPLDKETTPLKESILELVMNKTWRPCFTVLGISNLPENTGKVIKNNITIKISFRVPPKIDSGEAYNAMEKVIKENAPFHCTVSGTQIMAANGIDINNFSTKLNNVLNYGSRMFFGNDLAFRGEGGSIPFISFFHDNYPNADIANIGVSGQDSNDHGPNENLDLDACKKLIMTLSVLLSEY